MAGETLARSDDHLLMPARADELGSILRWYFPKLQEIRAQK